MNNPSFHYSSTQLGSSLEGNRFQPILGKHENILCVFMAFNSRVENMFFETSRKKPKGLKVCLARDRIAVMLRFKIMQLVGAVESLAYFDLAVIELWKRNFSINTLHVVAKTH